MKRGGRSARWKANLRWAAVGLLLTILTIAGVTAFRTRREGQSRDPRRLDLLYAAWNEFNARRYDQAAAILDRRATQASPTALDWMLRARIAESQGRPDEAIDSLKKIADTDAISAQAWLRIGQIEHSRHRARAAEAAYRHAETLDPNLVQTHRELAYLYALQRRSAECDAEFHTLARLMSLDHVLTFAWCQNYCRIWDPRECRKVLTAFLSEDPDDRASRLALTTSFQLTNQLDDAEEVLRALPDSDPDARALRAQFAIERGEIERPRFLCVTSPQTMPASTSCAATWHSMRASLRRPSPTSGRSSQGTRRPRRDSGPGPGASENCRPPGQAVRRPRRPPRPSGATRSEIPSTPFIPTPGFSSSSAKSASR